MYNPLGKKGESPFLRVRVSKEMLESLRKLAASEDRTVSNLVRRVLREHVEGKTRRKR